MALDQHIIQFIQRGFLEAHLCPTEEDWFFSTQQSPSYNFAEYHTELPPTRIECLQRSIIRKFLKLYEQ